jgi:hypothetical protein
MIQHLFYRVINVKSSGRTYFIRESVRFEKYLHANAETLRAAKNPTNHTHQKKSTIKSSRQNRDTAHMYFHGVSREDRLSSLSRFVFPPCSRFFDGPPPTHTCFVFWSSLVYRSIICLFVICAFGAWRMPILFLLGQCVKFMLQMINKH